MIKYEYCAAEFANHKDFHDRANDLGAEGWQLVTVCDVRMGHQLVIGYFMREAM